MITICLFATSELTRWTCSLKSYFGAVRYGIFQERVVSSVPAVAIREMYGSHKYPSYYPSHWNYTAVRLPCILDDSGIWYTLSNISSAPVAEGRSLAPFPLDGGHIRGPFPINAYNVSGTVPNACLYKMCGTTTIWRYGGL